MFYVDFYFKDKNAFHTKLGNGLCVDSCIKAVLTSKHPSVSRLNNPTAFYLKITRSTSHSKFWMFRVNKDH